MRLPSNANTSKPTINQFLPLWGLVIGVTLLIGILMFFFPFNVIHGRLLKQEEADNISQVYLRELVQRYPDNMQFRFLLAKNELNIGDIVSARKLIDPILLKDPNSENAWKAQWILYQILRLETYAQDPTSKSYDLGIKNLQHMIETLMTGPMTPNQMVKLGNEAEKIGNPVLADSIYQKILEGNHPLSARVYANGGRISLATSHYQTSVRFYLKAAEIAKSPNNKIDYYILALKSLQSGNIKGPQFQEILKSVSQYPVNTQQGTQLASIALSASLPELAEKFISQVIHYQKSQPLIPFDPVIYDLAYRTFLANNNITAAYSVAKSAVTQNPHDIFWHERLVQAAVWSNRGKKAVKEWLYLIEKQGRLSSDSLNLAIKFSDQMYDTPALIKFLNLKIKQGEASNEDWLRLARAYEEMGEPDLSMQILKKAMATQPDKNLFLENIAQLYQNMGMENEELQVFDELKKTEGLSLKMAIKIASIYGDRGDFDTALKNLLSVESKATLKNTDYWTALSSLAWRMQNQTVALQAYQKLYDANEMSELMLSRLYQLTKQQDADKAYHYAIEGFDRFHSEFFLYALLASGMDTKNWERIAEKISTLSAADQIKIKKAPVYWSLMANIYINKNQPERAIAVYKKAIQIFPENIDFKLTYLWFLISHGQKKTLIPLLSDWHYLLYKDKKFIDAFASAYLLLDQPRKAVELYLQIFSEKNQDIDYLQNLAYALDQAGLYPWAKRVRARALELLIHQIKKDIAFPTEYQLWLYANLVGQFFPGPKEMGVMYALINHVNSQRGNDESLLWALSKQYYALADYLVVKNQQAGFQTPAWMLDTLALHHQNNPALENLLKNHLSELPLRDRVQTAIQTGNQPLAESLSYDALKKTPEDYLTYQQFEQTFLPYADYFQTLNNFLRLNQIQGFQTISSYRWFYNHRWSVEPYVEYWQTDSQDPQALTNVPGHENDLGFSLHRQYRRGFVILNVGWKTFLRSFWHAKLDYTRVLTKKTNLEIQLGYNQLTTESGYLVAGGMQRNIDFLLTHQITPTTNLLLELNDQYFYGQDAAPLGRGLATTATLDQRIFAAYPEYTVGVYGSVRSYKSYPVSGAILTLIPLSLGVENAQILPPSFVQYGVHFMFGMPYANEYTKAWRPYALAAVFENSNPSQLGNNLILGIAGSVFGRDHLALFYERNSGGNGAGQSGLQVGAFYKIWF